MTGVTISTTQVAMAKENAEKAGVADRIRFQEMDGEKLDFPGEDGTFDAVWISEALSHFVTKPKFFAGALRLLKPGGKLVIADWFRADHISKKLEEDVIKPIEFGMLRE
jgi:tocopherol O-methyltransferase